MSRFRQPPSAPADIAGMVKEAIGELLLARAREIILRDDQLRDRAIWPSDIKRIVDDVTEKLRNEDRLSDDAELNVGGDVEADTVGELISEIEKAFAAVREAKIP